MKTRISLARGKSAFTLVELIVVIGLMGLLATISTGGYFAATRGMASRGAIQDTASIIRAAMQSCLIDQVPTAVLFCNFRSDTVGNGGDAYGRVIAIRMAGRVSLLSQSGYTSDGGTLPGNGLLIDEFGDWNRSYSREASTGNRQLGIYLYNMNESKLKSGIDQCSSLMCAWVGYMNLSRDYMIGTGSKADEWCKNHSADGNTVRWGLPFHPNNKGLGINEWQIGDAYGTQIAEFTLPRNYIYGTSVPTKAELVSASSPKALIFLPEDGKVTGLFSLGNSVTITMLKDVEGKNKELVGKITDEIIKDQD